jgi:hypothetical protein
LDEVGSQSVAMDSDLIDCGNLPVAKNSLLPENYLKNN